MKIERALISDGYHFPDNIKGIIMYVPNGVTRLEKYDLPGYDSKKIVRALIIPDSVLSMLRVNLMFYTNLKYVRLSKNIKIIGSDTFMYCGIRSITTYEKLRAIHEDAFYNCPYLKTVDLSKSNKLVLESHAFDMCRRIRNVKINENIKVSPDVFYNCNTSNIRIITNNEN